MAYCRVPKAAVRDGLVWVQSRSVAVGPDTVAPKVRFRGSYRATFGQDRPLEVSVRISPERLFAAQQGKVVSRRSPKARQLLNYHASAMQGVTPARHTRLVAGDGVDYETGRRRF